MRSFAIGTRAVGDGAPVLLIAELSANHRQSKELALRTIEAAARAGADAIKLQTYTPDTMTLRSDRPDFVVRTNNAWAGRTLYDLYAEAMTPWEWHAELKQAAESLGLICFSTPFDPTATDFLETLGVPVHKVASFELNDLPLVEHIARTGKPMILSTGMATLGEIEAALRVCREAGNDRLALLRCVSAYPARPEGMDLHSLEVLRGFDTVLGLSDHTLDHTVAIASVALGAKLIEKHFILERSAGGPDAFFSLEPAEFAALVKVVRDTEQALGHARFGAAPDELASTAFRRSLYVARDVKAGAVLTCDDVRCIRPAHGLAPRHFAEVLGRSAARDLSAGTALRWADVGGERAPTGVVLRPAERSDAELLLEWRNDETTRAMSESRERVSDLEHQRWLGDVLAERPTRLFIVVHDGAPVGTVRLDPRPHQEAAVSITIAPAARGARFATASLIALEAIAAERAVVRLVARIRRENAASIRAFKRAGFYAFSERGADARFVQCERRLLAYG
jgi:pseudaminic acid synthase